MQLAARRLAFSSSRCSRKEFCDKTNAAFQSNIQRHWRSSSAAVSPDSFKQQRGQKKLSKEERRAMVEGFVEKYRASNAGKFPSVSCAQKQVGGSYYIIREIVQELEYNHKRAPLETEKEFKLGREEIIKCKKSTLSGEPIISVESRQNSIKEYANQSAQIAEHSNGKFVEGTGASSRISVAYSDNKMDTRAHKQVTTKKVTAGSVEDRHLTFNRVQTQAHIKKPSHTEEAATSASLLLEAEERSMHLSPVETKNCVKDANSATPSQDSHSPEQMQTSTQEALRSEALIPGQEELVERGAPRASSFWGNLKSFAYGIISIWK
ncbi:hypothetical protein AXF42_Ash005153 [Apostasia shenzhenica]|uniref:AT3G52170-like helix-turn-helix domain-containing protein n=1 Tax=Apostasia shenzhenica TaxID=1088818 RepID=A0A2I0B8R6_9ASPA|nr:hypothetical protein AXF42_Ash005153 [Apostasia shenzhenica]